MFYGVSSKTVKSLGQRFAKKPWIMGIVSNICRFRVEVEQTPNLDASGNRRTNPDPKFSTRLTAKDLILRLTTLYLLRSLLIYHCHFRHYGASSLWWASSENCYHSITGLAIGALTLTKLQKYLEFCQTTSSQHDRDTALISAYITDTCPDKVFFVSSFYP